MTNLNPPTMNDSLDPDSPLYNTHTRLAHTRVSNKRRPEDGVSVFTLEGGGEKGGGFLLNNLRVAVARGYRRVKTQGFVAAVERTRGVDRNIVP